MLFIAPMGVFDATRTLYIGPEFKLRSEQEGRRHANNATYLFCRIPEHEDEPGRSGRATGRVPHQGRAANLHRAGSHRLRRRLLSNLATIRVPVIAAIEERAHVHSEYALLANVIVAGKGATFHDAPHFVGGIAPGDGIFTTWSYRAGAGRAEAFLLNPRPLTAQTAYEWGVVAEVVPNGQALSRARELAALYLKAPEVTRRYTRIHFIQPLNERIVREVSYGLPPEGASSAAQMRSRVKSEAA